MVEDRKQERQRLSFDINANKPHSKYTREKFPPEKYPINCTFFISSRDIEIIEKMKEALKIIPSTDYKFQKKKHRSMDIITVDIYVKTPDCIRPIASVVKEKELFVDKVIGEEKILPRNLVSMAQDVAKGEGLNR